MFEIPIGRTLVAVSEESVNETWAVTDGYNQKDRVDRKCEQKRYEPPFLLFPEKVPEFDQQGRLLLLVQSLEFIEIVVLRRI